MPMTIREIRQEGAIRGLEAFLRAAHKDLRLDLASTKLIYADDPTARLHVLRGLAIQSGYSLQDLAPFDC